MDYNSGDLLGGLDRGVSAFYLAPNRGWDDQHNGKLGQDSSFEYVARGFFEAGEELADGCMANKGSIDFKFYPLLFLYWHGVELALKHIARHRAEILGESLPDGKPTGHKVLVLWDAVRGDLEAIVHDSLSGPDFSFSCPYDVDDVNALLRDLASIDREGISFRYPKSQHGDALLRGVDAVSVQRAHDVLKALGQTFIAWMAAISEESEILRIARREREQRRGR